MISLSLDFAGLLATGSLRGINDMTESSYWNLGRIDGQPLWPKKSPIVLTAGQIVICMYRIRVRP